VSDASLVFSSIVNIARQQNQLLFGDDEAAMMRLDREQEFGGREGALMRRIASAPKATGLLVARHA